MLRAHWYRKTGRITKTPSLLVREPPAETQISMALRYREMLLKGKTSRRLLRFLKSCYAVSPLSSKEPFSTAQSHIVWALFHFKPESMSPDDTALDTIGALAFARHNRYWRAETRFRQEKLNIEEQRLTRKLKDPDEWLNDLPPFVQREAWDKTVDVFGDWLSEPTLRKLFNAALVPPSLKQTNHKWTLPQKNVIYWIRKTLKHIKFNC